jgi:N-acetylglucosamine-6-phosphate deacetylase
VARIYLEDAVLLDPEQRLPAPGGLLLDGAHIVGQFRPDHDAPHDAERIALGGRYLAPGFIDLHYHGRFVFEPAPGSNDAFDDAFQIAAQEVRHGITAYLPTTVAQSAERLAERITSMTHSMTRCETRGARPLGLHLEGPWINAAAAGAQPRAGIRPCDLAEARDLLARGAGEVRMLTLAPEIEGSHALLELLQCEGVVAALGHSHAPADCVTTAIERGARHVTHLFNAMAPLHHRAPGLAGVALTDERLTADLICDGVHVDFRVVKLAARALGERLMLITDRLDPPRAVRDAGFGSGPVHDDGTALRLADGRLAGSRLSLDLAIRNAVAAAGLPLLEALAACTLRPARLLGLEGRIGCLRPGARADLVVLDADGQVRETWVGGRRLYRA